MGALGTVGRASLMATITHVRTLDYPSLSEFVMARPQSSY